MAQHVPIEPQPQRVPMMDAAMLDARTRPVEHEPVPIWLRHRLQGRHMREATTPPGRARSWLRQLAGRGEG